MKKLLIASMLGSVAFAGAATAQTAPATTTEPAAQTAPAATGTMGGEAAMANEGGFITYQEGTQLLGSGLMGADVRGSDGESIGTVDDILLDRDGQVQAVVVGIGGFLGIGQRDVAIANDQLEFVLAQDAAADTTAGTAATGTAATGTGGAMAPAETGAATAPAAPMGAGTTADTTAPASTGMAAGTTEGDYGWSGAGIDHIQVSYTRDQLENAPPFESAE